MIRALLQNGKKFHSPNLTLYLDRNLPEVAERFLASYIVSSAQIPRAVDRNRLRRWLREDTRLYHQSNTLSGAMIVKFKGGEAKVTHPQLTEELNSLFKAALGSEN